MSGKIKLIIDRIIDIKSNDNPALRNLNRTKLILKGVDVNRYNEDSVDDIEKINVLKSIANVSGIDLSDILISTELVIVSSENKSIVEAIQEIKSKLIDIAPKVVLFFTSSDVNAELVSGKMKEVFPESLTLGCTGSHLQVSDQMCDNAIIAMGLSDEIVEDFKFEIIKMDASDDNYNQAYNSIINHFAITNNIFAPEKYLGLVLHDWMPENLPDIMEKMGEYLNILLAGGTAGAAELDKTKTKLYIEGKVYKDASIILVLKSKKKFDVFKTHSFVPYGYELVTTKVNPNDQRIVLELNNNPAAQELAKALNIKIEELGRYSSDYYLGLEIEGEFYNSTFNKVLEDDALLFHGKLHEDYKYQLLKFTDITKSNKEALERRNISTSNILGIINFNCCGRLWRLERESKIDGYLKTFEGIPLIGLGSFGEEYICHLEGTSVMIVFRDEFV